MKSWGPRGLVYISTVLSILSASAPKVLAGDRETLIFSREGARIHVREGAEIPENPLLIEPRVEGVCAAIPNRKCVPWALQVSPQESQVSQILSQIMTGFSLWNSQSSLGVQFAYNGAGNFVGVPYEYVPGSEPQEIIEDEFGNEVVSGNFFVSFLPDSSMEFPAGVVSASVKYVVPSLEAATGDIRWAGVFLNPAYTPIQQYRLDWVIAHEAGRMMGLGPSGNRTAIMYPVLPNSTSVPLRLSNDDLLWAEGIYPLEGSSAARGRVTGSVLSGESGAGISNAQVELIPVSRIDQFAQSASRLLAEVSAFTNAEGHFEFPKVAPGDYVLIVEPIDGIQSDRSKWDDVLWRLASTQSFPVEFYDGAGRESNLEGSLEFSPRLIQQAAILSVQANRETSGIQIFTNISNLQAEVRVATGSNNERLPSRGSASAELDKRLKALLENAQKEQEDLMPKVSVSGGCELRSNASSSGMEGFLFGVFLLILLRAGLKTRSSRFASR